MTPATGIAIINFGASGSNEASTLVIDQLDALATRKVEEFIMADDKTIDHTAQNFNKPKYVSTTLTAGWTAGSLNLNGAAVLANATLGGRFLFAAKRQGCKRNSTPRGAAIAGRRVVVIHYHPLRSNSMRFIDVTCTQGNPKEGKKLLHDMLTDRRFWASESQDPAKAVDDVYAKEANEEEKAVNASKANKAE